MKLHGLIKDGRVTSLSSEPFNGSEEVERIEGSDTDTHIVAGFEYKHKRGKHLLVPVMVERSPEAKAKQVRKQKESKATVEFLEHTVKADDKAVSMLQAYIGSNIEAVQWRCVEGFLELDKEGMAILLGMILDKKAQLFEEEMSNGNRVD